MTGGMTVLAPEELSLSAAARRLGVGRRTLLRAYERGDVRAHDRGGRLTFLAPELDEDADRHRCRYPGCSGLALGESGGCSDHAVGLALTGRPRSAEDIAKITAGRQKKHGPGEERSCEWCEEPIGHVRGSRVVAGHGRFCSHRCAGLSQWASKKVGSEITCPGCGFTRYVSPSVVIRTSGYCQACSLRLPEHITRLADARASAEERRAHDLACRKAAERLLDTREAAELIGLTPGGFRRHVVSGLIPVVRMGDANSVSLYRKAEVESAAAALAFRAEELGCRAGRRPIVARWRTVDYQLNQLVARGELDRYVADGLTPAAALRQIEADAKAAVTRRRRIYHRRAGRPRSDVVRARRARRAERHHEILDELVEEYARHPDEPRQGLRMEAAKQLAQEENAYKLTGSALLQAAKIILIDISRAPHETPLTRR